MGKIENLIELILSPHIPLSKFTHFQGEECLLSGVAGVYRIFKNTSWKESLYIEESKDLCMRLCNNLINGSLESHILLRKLSEQKKISIDAIKRDLKENYSLQYIIIKDDKERKLFEKFAISTLRSLFND
ncbi:MAG: hypothetical protein NZ870_01715 [bacterium]|nr:hypothetical protein [bacterium]